MLRRDLWAGKSWLSLGACVLLGAVVAGCAQSAPTYQGVPVKGTVTLDGKPLVDGEIQFKTIATGALDSMPIVNGEYSGAAQAGTKRVEIFAFKAPPPANPDSPPSDVEKVNYLPPRYNLNSTLSAEVKDLGSTANEFKFEVTTR